MRIVPLLLLIATLNATTHCPLIAATAGSQHTCVLLATGLKCWGDSLYGRLGFVTSGDIGDNYGEMGLNLPYVDLGVNLFATKLSASQRHTCAVLNTGDLKCWGYNYYGQLGQGDRNYRGDDAGEMGDNLPPINLGDGVTVQQVCTGDYHTCALLNDGSIKCWGRYLEGQLGFSTVNIGDNFGEMGNALPRVDLGVGIIATSVKCGYYSTCALLEDSTIKCWGSGSNGILGQGNTDNIGYGGVGMGDSLPRINLGTTANIRQISMGVYTACVLFEAGSVKCWGRNSYGQLGLEDTNDRGDNSNEMGDNLPYVNFGSEVVESISCGWVHCCALLVSRKMKCWGHGTYGQLGLETTSTFGNGPDEMGDHLPYIDLGYNISVHSIIAGYYHTCAILVDLRLKCWGNNADGRLGLEISTLKIGDTAGSMGDNLPFVILAPNQVGYTDCSTVSCPAGTTSDESVEYRECYSCPTGLFSSVASNCQSCQAGYKANDNQDDCEPCVSGRYTNDSLDCHDCDPGRYSNEGSSSCDSCQGGYKANDNQDNCEPCVSGHYTNDSLDCYDCDPGRISNEGSSSCDTCQGGYKANDNQDACEPCVSGRYKNDSIDCYDCDPGRISNEGASICENCQGGYKANDNQDGCEPCVSGRYTNDSLDCYDCDPGRISNESASSCESCQAGYKANDNQDACEPCVSGRYTNDSLDCYDCDPGRISLMNGSSECSTCSIGRYSMHHGSSECFDCIDGYYALLEGSSSCDCCEPGKYGLGNACHECQLGTYNDTCGAVTCGLCPLGRFGVRNGSTECPACPAGKTSPPSEGSTSCDTCPKGRWSGEGSSTCSQCSEGTYAAEEASSGCSFCPDEAECSAGSSEWFLSPGVWRDPEEPFAFSTCIPEEACASTGYGETNCSDAYSGERCGECNQGYYRQNEYCIECGSSFGTIALIFIVLISVTAVSYIAVTSTKFKMTRRSLRIIVGILQIVSKFSVISVHWPAEMITFFNVLSVTNFDVNLIGPECAFTMDYWTKWKLMQFLPLYIAGAFCVIYVILIFGFKTPFNLTTGQRIFKAYATVILLLYTSIAFKTFEPLKCIQVDDSGTEVVFQNPSVSCSSHEYESQMPYVMMSIVFYCILAPMLFILLLYYNRKKFQDDNFRDKHSYITDPYADEYFYWEVVVILKRILMILFIDLTNSSIINAFCGIICLLGYILLIVKYRPRKTNRTNFFESLWNAVAIVVLCSVSLHESGIALVESKMTSYGTIGFVVLSLMYWALVHIELLKERRDLRRNLGSELPPKRY